VSPPESGFFVLQFSQAIRLFEVYKRSLSCFSGYVGSQAVDNAHIYMQDFKKVHIGNFRLKYSQCCRVDMLLFVALSAETGEAIWTQEPRTTAFPRSSYPISAVDSHFDVGVLG
jgi:hypothetical protein